MNFPTYFKTFLKDEVNINQTRLDDLTKRVDAVYAALCADEKIGPFIKDKIPQGSWPHRTIIRPKAGGEFDADFLLLIDEQDDWEPKAYPDAVYAALGRSPMHKDMPRQRRTRAVCLTYSPAKDIGCHLDIVPYVARADGSRAIIDRVANLWEPTNPVAFTTWMAQRDDITNGNFRKVVRLMKYYKVHRNSFNGVRSIILTTLLGEQVVSADAAAADPTLYSNLPATLLAIVTSLDDYLQARPTIPTIVNPAGDGTTFDHRWDQPTYTNFRARMKTCAEKMQAASDENDAEQAATLWQDVFGSAFKPLSSSGTAGRFEAGAAPSTPAYRSGKSG